jgi:glycine/D-amino acid oxidase-like deaminating enzyme
VESQSIECDFSRLDGFLFSDEASVLELERRAAEAAGVPVEWVPVPLARWAGGELRFLDQAQLDPVRFTRGLAAAATAAGAKMFGHARVTRPARGRMCTPTRSAWRVTWCRDEAPVGGFLTLDARQAAYRTYVIGLEVEGDGIPEALYWDTDEPFHYVRTCRAPDGAELLLVGGEDHKTGQGPSHPEERWKRLETWTHRSFPNAGAVRHRWSGQIMETMDGLAFIGAIQPGIHVVTGDCGNGITHALIAGQLVPDLVERKPSRWEPV